MQSKIKDTVPFENDEISLIGNIFLLKRGGHSVSLSKKQTALFNCLINEVNDRKEIIEYVWPGENAKSKLNNYNQLVFQTRVLLVKNGFPKDTIITISMYGVCLNMKMLKPTMKKYGREHRVFGDQGFFK